MRLIDADVACKGCVRYGTSLSCEECVVKETPTIDTVLVPNYRVPSKEEWMERYCTKKQLAGYEKRKEATNGTD